MALLAVVLIAPASAGAAVSPNNQWGRPTGRPQGWVMVVHGGGWQVVGPAAVAATQPYAQFFTAHGWGTYNIDYRRGELSLTDVLSAYDLLRGRVGTRVPVCVAGYSAGGNLALLLSAYRSSVDCVISEGGPTDLVSFPFQPAWAPPDVPLTTGPDWTYDSFIVPSFGASRAGRWRFSPVRVARSIHARMLLGSSTFDALVPHEQMLEMRRLRPGITRTMLLAGASTTPLNFTHASVTAGALAAWQRAESQLLAAAKSAVSAAHHA